MRIGAEALEALGTRILSAIGCNQAVAAEMAAHLVEAEAMGVTSHGVIRLPQYADAAQKGGFRPGAEPSLDQAAGGAAVIDGGGGFGVPALRLGMATAVEAAQRSGAGAVGVRNVYHTGRIGAFVAQAAEAGCLGIVAGGGGRQACRQVAPFGGRRAVLPTNPWAFGVPGGEHGALVVDFATSAAAQGKLMAVRAAGGRLSEGVILDREGRPSTDPEDYYAGGAILPAAGPKGYGLALLAEVLGETLMGEAAPESNWLAIAVDLGRFADRPSYGAAAEAILAEMRAADPLPGVERVEVPGEREAARAEAARRDGIDLPDPVADRIRQTAGRLGVDAAELSA